jgi:hypothetical protein
VVSLRALFMQTPNPTHYPWYITVLETRSFSYFFPGWYRTACPGNVRVCILPGSRALRYLIVQWARIPAVSSLGRGSGMTAPDRSMIMRWDICLYHPGQARGVE